LEAQLEILGPEVRDFPSEISVGYNGFFATGTVGIFKMICNTCRRMLSQHEGFHWRGTYDLEFDHHTSVQDLLYSAEQNCCICRVLFAKWKKVKPPEASADTDADPERQRHLLRAGLKFDRKWGVYRLGFRLKNNENIGNFALKHLKDDERVRDMFLRQLSELMFKRIFLTKF
jgi:hypothetical protein